MKDAYYFPHDSNARHDEKIQYIIYKFGIGGYGLYWLFIETMHEQSDGKLTCALLEGLSLGFNVDITLLKQFYNEAISIELFVTDDIKYWSDRVLKNKQILEQKRSLKSEAGKRGMQSRWVNNNSVITKNNSVITKHNKVNESKVNESKLKESRLYVTPEKFYNDNFGAITPHMADNIKHFIDDGVEEDLIIQKMKEAIEQNKRNWAWVQQALLNLQADSIKTLDDYKSLKKEFNKKKSNKSKDSPEKSMYKEVTDDWEWPDHKDLD